MSESDSEWKWRYSFGNNELADILTVLWPPSPHEQTMLRVRDIDYLLTSVHLARSIQYRGIQSDDRGPAPEPEPGDSVELKLTRRGIVARKTRWLTGRGGRWLRGDAAIALLRRLGNIAEAVAASSTVLHYERLGDGPEFTLLLRRFVPFHPGTAHAAAESWSTLCVDATFSDASRPLLGDARIAARLQPHLAAYSADSTVTWTPSSAGISAALRSTADLTAHIDAALRQLLPIKMAVLPVSPADQNPARSNEHGSHRYRSSRTD